MMSAASIIQMQDEAAAKAAAEHKEPLILWKADDLFQAPFLGGYEAPGWRNLRPSDLDDVELAVGIKGKVVRHMDDLEDGVVDLFCDSSGWCSPSEPALTPEEAQETVEALLEWAKEKHYSLGVSIQQAGQFQVYVRLHVHVRQAQAA